MRQSSGPRVALPLPPNEAPHIKQNTPGNSTSRSTLFGSFTPTRSEENPAHLQQPPRKPHLPYLSQDSEVTVAPCCLTRSSHGLGSTSTEGQRSIAQTPTLAQIPGKQPQSTLTLCMVTSPTLILALSIPKVTLSQPQLGNTGEVCSNESSHLWQAQEGPGSGRNTARKRHGWSQTHRPKV